MNRIATVIWLLCATSPVPAFGADTPVRDAIAAIKKAQFVCKLEPHGLSGGWQATLKKDFEFGDEWHVWFGKKPEPVCGFAGAIVKADGSYTSCVVTACKRISPKPRELRP
jgi:hypothetical protein